MNSPTWLIAWTFSPIQPFIATTRKGRDLWYASWLLSDVARGAAKRATAHDATLLSPGDVSRLNDPDYSVANKVLAYTDGTREQALHVAQAMSESLKERLNQLASTLVERIARDGGLPESIERRGGPQVPAFDHRRIREQIADALQDAWVVVPIPPTPNGVVGAREQAERLLTATKAARGFQQPSWAATVPKASVDGEREAVLEQELYGRNQRRERASWMQKLDLRPGEQVCGVTLLKRKGPAWLAGQTAARVESTSHFAAIPFLRQFSSLSAEQRQACVLAWEAFLQAAADANPTRLPRQSPLPIIGDHDAHLLYPTRLHDLAWPSREQDPSERESLAPQEVLDAHRDLMKALRQARRSLRPEQQGPAAPSPYYAVLMADGDRIGARLRDAKSTQELRGCIGVLDAFSSKVPGIIEKTALSSGVVSNGQCIYAGGDDVLAFLPVDAALEVAFALHEAFKQAWTGANAPTLSVAIVIAHHLTPLQETLQAARAAERAAKKDFGRDAWAVDLRKRGGVPLLVGGHWEAPPTEDDTRRSWDEAATWPGMRRLIEDYRRRSLPRGLPHELRDLAEQLGQTRPGRSGATGDEVHVRLAVRAILAQKDHNRPGWHGPDGAAEHVLNTCEALGLRAAAERLIIARALTGLDAEDE